HAARIQLSMFPRLFHVGNFSLPTYGVMAALGMIAGLSVVVRGARREGVDPDKAWNLGIIGVLAGIIGAKVLMVINDWHYYTEHPKSIFTLATLQAGGVFYGGLLAAVGGLRLHRLHAYAAAEDLRHLRAGHRAGTRHRAPGLLRRRLLLRQGNACAVGRHVHQSPRQRVDRDSAQHSDASHADLRVPGGGRQLRLPLVAAEAQTV